MLNKRHNWNENEKSGTVTDQNANEVFLFQHFASDYVGVGSTASRALT